MALPKVIVRTFSQVTHRLPSTLAGSRTKRMKIKSLLLLLLIFTPFLLIHTLKGPIPQDQAYHQFADTRPYLGIPNFWNVTSNLLFTVFGLLGVHLWMKSPMKFSWLVFFSGAALVGPGSAYYHLNPHDTSLVPDRLPMTIAFAGIVSAVLTEVFSLKREKGLLALTLGVGIYSVLHWQVFGDLRLYAWVQLTPMVVLLYVAFALNTAELKSEYLMYAFGWYFLAKIMEHYDARIYSLLDGAMGGHALKHVFASFGILSIYLMKKSPSDQSS